MSIATIEARTLVLMGQHKEQLARRVAEYEDASAPYSAYAEPNVMEQGTEEQVPITEQVRTDSPLTPDEQVAADQFHALAAERESLDATAVEVAAVEGADAAPAEEPAKKLAAKKAKVAK